MAEPKRIIFAGTPEFAAVALRRLIRDNHKIVAVYCQPDRPSGRGRIILPGPVKQVALDHRLPIEQPHDFKSEAAIASLQELHADLMVVAAYGLILPRAVLDAPQSGCINIHASLLPRWRGAAPIQRAICAGDPETGVCIMRMEEGLDTGPVFYSVRTPIDRTDTATSLHDRLAELGAEALIHVLEKWEHLKAVPQPQSGALYARKLEKHEAWINWNDEANHIDCQIRGLNPWPIAQTWIGKEILRIHRAQPCELRTDVATPPGTILHLETEGWIVKTGKGNLRIEQAQLPGGNILQCSDLARSRSWITPGILLGEHDE